MPFGWVHWVFAGSSAIDSRLALCGSNNVGLMRQALTTLRRWDPPWPVGALIVFGGIIGIELLLGEGLRCLSLSPGQSATSSASGGTAPAATLAHARCIPEPISVSSAGPSSEGSWSSRPSRGINLVQRDAFGLPVSFGTITRGRDRGCTLWIAAVPPGFPFSRSTIPSRFVRRWLSFRPGQRCADHVRARAADAAGPTRACPATGATPAARGSRGKRRG